MKSQPHILVRKFEVWVLRPLDFAFYGVTVYYLFHRAWILSCTLIVLSILVGSIGQNLQHRRHETTRELASGSLFAEQFRGELSTEDARALGKSVMAGGLLLGFTVAILLTHHGSPWYSSALGGVCSWLVFVILSVLIVFAASWRRHRGEL